MAKIQEKLDSQLRKNKKINNTTSENYKETPIFLTDLKTAIIALEQEKTRLESQLLNFRSPHETFDEEEKQQNVSFIKKPQVYPNLFSDDYDTQEMNLKQYQSLVNDKKNMTPVENIKNKTLQPGKSGHTRAKSAPKNVNPMNAGAQEYGSFQNPEELIEELNYLASYSNPRLNESENSTREKNNNNNNSNEYNGKSLQQNFEDNLSYQRINVNNYSNEYMEDDKNSSGNNSYENNKNIFDLNQIPLNNPNSRNLTKQYPLTKSIGTLYPMNNSLNNRSLSNEQKKQINVSIQSLIQEASGNNPQMINSNNNNNNQSNMTLIRRCKYSSLHQDCSRHKKFFKFNLDSCSLKEIQFFESVFFYMQNKLNIPLNFS